VRNDDLPERPHGKPVIANDAIGITPSLSVGRIYYPNYVMQARCITPFLSAGPMFVSALGSFCDAVESNKKSRER
jgi:hypothetical protein